MTTRRLPTDRPQQTHCKRCGFELQESQISHHRRRIHLVCDGCGQGHHDLELAAYLEARWEDAGRPWLGTKKGRVVA